MFEFVIMTLILGSSLFIITRSSPLRWARPKGKGAGCDCSHAVDCPVAQQTACAATQTPMQSRAGSRTVTPWSRESGIS
jgi:hypothetical protein